MNFLAEIKIMPLKELLDPQGKAVMGGFESWIKKHGRCKNRQTYTIEIQAAMQTKQNKLQKKHQKNYWQSGNGRIYN